MSKPEKLVTIVVNEDDYKVPKDEISYDEVVAFYIEGGGKPSKEYLIKYSKGPHQNPKGTLSPDEAVFVKDEMHFRVSGTGES